MPILMQPEAVWKVWLECDKTRIGPDGEPEDVPESERPTFFFRALSGRQFIEVAGLSDEVDDARDGKLDMSSADMFRKYLDILHVGLVGWQGMKRREGDELVDLPFDRDALGDLVAMPEVFELKQKMLRGPLLGTDRKKSEPQSPSDSEDSASTAGPASA